MSVLDSEFLSVPNTIDIANKAKRTTLIRLLKDGVINQEQYEKYMSDWQFVAVKCGWFKYWKNRLNGTKEEDYIIKLVNFED